MARPSLCEDCEMCSDCKQNQILCKAMNTLIKTYRDYKKEVARDIITGLRPLLSEEDAEECTELCDMGEKVCSAIEELAFIKEYEIKIGYVKSYEEKMKNGKAILADCRKVESVYGAYIPFDFIITFYEPNIIMLSENQKKVLMWHELKHIGLNERTLKTEYKILPHEIEDFYSITDRLGTRWDAFNEDIEDILKGVE